ncbi:MAG: OsmC family peroxiredoxin [Saprospiraceae bacterium]|nr:OsmC family peroxiredoxin [Saprospiraceae bacterium]
MKRHATAVWEGTGKEGRGGLTTQSTVLNDTQYAFSSRFEDGIGTNPEELVAAAHAGCFAMKLAFLVNAEDLTADRIEVKCDVTLRSGAVTNSHLTVRMAVPGLTREIFDKVLADAEENCTISKLLNTEITMDAEMV